MGWYITNSDQVGVGGGDMALMHGDLIRIRIKRRDAKLGQFGIQR